MAPSKDVKPTTKAQENGRKAPQAGRETKPADAPKGVKSVKSTKVAAKAVVAQNGAKPNRRNATRSVGTQTDDIVFPTAPPARQTAKIKAPRPGVALREPASVTVPEPVGVVEEQQPPAKQAGRKRNAKPEPKVSEAADVGAEEEGKPDPPTVAAIKVVATAVVAAQTLAPAKQKRGSRAVSGVENAGNEASPEATGERKAEPLVGNKRGNVTLAPEQTVEQTMQKPGMKEFTRPWVLSEKLLDKANRTFPSYNITQKSGPLHVHDHPYSAIERAITEDIAVEALVRAGCKRITDIGGNPSRHKGAGRVGVHSCCPILSPGDVVRNARYTDKMDFCEERVEDCKKDADGYLAVHSIYYLTPATVLDLLHKASKRVFVATAHKFTGGYGQMHHNGEYYESQYAIVEPDVVEMTVKGNDHGAYRHSPSFWLETNYFHSGGKAMAWGYRQYGDTFVYTFVPAPVGLSDGVSTQELSLFESARLDSHYGEVSTGLEAYRPTVELLNITTTKVTSFGPLFWTTRKSQDIFVPKTIINRLATFMVGKPRNKDTLQMCIREAKKMLSDKYMTIPEALRTMLCIHCPGLAFVIHLDDEIAAFNTLLEPAKAGRYAQLSAALSQTPRALTYIERLAKAVTPHKRIVAAYGTEDVKSYAQGDPTQEHTSTLVADEIEGTYKDDHTLLTVVKAKASGGFKFVATPAVGAYKKMRKAAVMKLRGDGKDKDPSKPSIFQTSTVFADHAPICAVGSQEDEVMALRNRVLMEVPPGDAAYWQVLTDRFDSEKLVDVDRIKAAVNFDQDSAFKAWNSGFPKGKARNQELAYGVLKTRPIEEKDLLRKTFCKIEKAVKLHSDEGELIEFVPRAIQGGTDEANVALGPFIAQVSKQLAKQWDGTKKFYYTSGATGISVGAWLARHYHPGDYLVDIDFSSYDGTQNRCTFDFTRRFYEACGISEYGEALKVLDSHKEIHGFTRNNVEYRVNDGMCSGNPDTSSSNSLVTGASAELGYETHFGTTDGIHIAAMGDDNTAIVPAHLMATTTPDALKKHLVAHFLRLGFIAKVNITDVVAKGEFCSGLFWPAQVGGVETYVLGGKPGKQLPKIGYSLKNHAPDVVAGMFEGLAQAYAHVPLLSDYAEITRTKLPAKAGKYVDPESRYKIQAGGDSISKSVHLADFFEERYGLDLDVVTSSLRQLLLDADLTDMVHWTFLDVLVATDC